MWGSTLGSHTVILYDEAQLALDLRRFVLRRLTVKTGLKTAKNIKNCKTF